MEPEANSSKTESNVVRPVSASVDGASTPATDIKPESSLQKLDARNPLHAAPNPINNTENRRVSFLRLQGDVQSDNQGALQQIEAQFEEHVSGLPKKAEVIQKSFVYTKNAGRASFCATVGIRSEMKENGLIQHLKSDLWECDRNFLGITPVFAPPGDVDVDIIAVHGLLGHPVAAWKHKTQESDIWLRDWLPQDFKKKDDPRIRVLLYGHDTSKSYNSCSELGSALLGWIHDYRKRDDPKGRHPIIFVAHSLGGLVVKEAMLAATELEHQGDAEFLSDVYALCLFGVPNRGLRHDVLLSEVDGKPSHQLAKDLVVEDDQDPGGYLESHHKLFSEKFEKKTFKIDVFFEGRLSEVFELNEQGERTTISHMIRKVKKDSANNLGVPTDSCNKLDADHTGLVRYESKHQAPYILVRNHLKSRAKEALNRSEDPTSVPHRPMSEDESKCLRSLRTSDYERFKDRNPPRLKGTCRWFFENDHFKAWQAKKTSTLLWVTADPGCGKSVLSKSLVDLDLKATTSRATCHFFFKDDNEDQKDITNAIAALLHQLLSQKPFLVRHALPDHRKEGDWLGKSFSKLWDILVSIADDPRTGQVVCVLDAIDECSESRREELMSALQAFYNRLPTMNRDQSALKFIITSSPHFDVERRFSELAHIRLQGEKESETIGLEINEVITAEVTKLKHLDKAEQSFVKRELLSMKQRTYLWLKLIIPELRGLLATTKPDLKETIETLPRTVDEAFEKILSRSRGRDREKTRKLLHIIVAATRPLTIKEMNIALAIEYQHNSLQSLNLESDSRFEHTVRNLCGLFVNVVDQRVYLIHKTAKTFLVTKERTDGAVWKGSLWATESQLIIARTCITYLLFPVFARRFTSQVGDSEREDGHGEDGHEEDGHEEDSHEEDSEHVPSDAEPLSSDSVDILAEKHGYLEYAACYWPIHFRQAQKVVPREMLLAALELLKVSRYTFYNWYNVYWHVMHPGTYVPRSSTDIMIASYFGHDVVVKQLLSSGGDAYADSKDSYGRTPLSYAAEYGHEAVVDMLLALVENGKVNPDVKAPFSGRTPLMYAAMQHEGVVVKLLNLVKSNKIDPGDKDTQDYTPLMLAVMFGNEGIVQKLLALVEDGKVDPDCKNFANMTPLSLAARKGDEKLVKMLLGWVKSGKVDPDAKDGYERTPLSWAAEGGHEGIVKKLLALVKTGQVNPDKMDCYKQTPLSIAAQGGHEGVVKRLLALVKRGTVNPNLKCDFGRTPLWYAAYTGNGTVIDMFMALVKQGSADSVSEDNQGFMPQAYAERFPPRPRKGRGGFAGRVLERNSSGELVMGVLRGEFEMHALLNPPGPVFASISS